MTPPPAPAPPRTPPARRRGAGRRDGRRRRRAGLFASRADFEAAAIPDDLEGWSIRHAGHVLGYRRDPDGTAIASANGVTGSPAGTPSALHWGAAPGAAPAVNAAAMNACAAWGQHVHLPAGIYEIDAPLLFAPDEASGRAACVLRGDGMEATVLVQTVPSADAVQFIHANPAREFCIMPQVRDLSIRHPGAAAAHAGAAIRHRQSLQGSFERIVIDGASFGIVSERSKASYSRIYFRTGLRAEGQRARAAFVLDHDPVLGAGQSFGNFVSDCEFQAVLPGVDRIFELRAVDGLYISTSHFGHCERHLLIDCTAQGGGRRSATCTSPTPTSTSARRPACRRTCWCSRS
jgi:hypothetical protein